MQNAINGSILNPYHGVAGRCECAIVEQSVTHRINPFQVAFIRSFFGFTFKADVIKLQLVGANQISGWDLIVVAHVKIHLLIVDFFFENFDTNLVVENRTKFVSDVLCSRFSWSHSMKGKHFYFNVSVNCSTYEFHWQSVAEVNFYS